MTEEQKAQLKAGYLGLYEKAGIYLTDEEKGQVFHWDFYTGSPDVGLSCVTYFKTARCCGRELAMLPGRVTPAHRHPPALGTPGREKTLRCRYGSLRVHVGDRAVELLRGGQVTIPPDTMNWMEAGQSGAVISEFSTEALDRYDVYDAPEIMKEHSKDL